MKKLERAFYNRDAIIVAQELLGKTLVHETQGKRMAVRIVETEAYMGCDDKAAHSYGGRRTPRVEVMYGDPGFSYVFTVYGWVHCFNVITQEKGNPQGVLIRAAQPLEGMEEMAQRRFKIMYNQLTPRQQRALTNGPGKVCQALAIDRNFNTLDVCGSTLYFTEGNPDPFNIIETKRVGIDYAEEAIHYPWRFYIEGNDYVSVK